MKISGLRLILVELILAGMSRSRSLFSWQALNLVTFQNHAEISRSFFDRKINQKLKGLSKKDLRLLSYFIFHEHRSFKLFWIRNDVNSHIYCQVSKRKFVTIEVSPVIKNLKNPWTEIRFYHGQNMTKTQNIS